MKTTQQLKEELAVGLDKELYKVQYAEIGYKRKARRDFIDWLIGAIEKAERDSDRIKRFGEYNEKV